MIDRTPAEVFHPSEFILDELESRGWTLDDLARRMPGDFGANVLALEMYLEFGPGETGLRIGNFTVGLGAAFECDPSFFVNLEKAWLAHASTRVGG